MFNSRLVSAVAAGALFVFAVIPFNAGAQETLPPDKVWTLEDCVNYALEENIPPLTATLKKLEKFSGAGRGVTLTFNAELLGQRVIWDEANDTLTIKGVPANLKDQLQRNKY